MDLVNIDFESFEKSVKDALDAIAAHKQIAEQSAILIKPNLTTDSPHPITTAPECCEVIIEYIRKYSKAEIVIAEGCGDVNHETDEVFKNLGYTAMAEFHLGGAQCDPNVKRIIAGYNPWKVDREAAGLLGLNWNNIGHIAAGFR